MNEQRIGFIVEGLRELELVAASDNADKKLRIKSKMMAILGDAFDMDGTFWAVEKKRLKREIFYNLRMNDAELDSAFDSLPSMQIDSNSIVGFFSLPNKVKAEQPFVIPEHLMPQSKGPQLEVWDFASFDGLPERVLKKTKEFSKKHNYSPGSMYLIGHRKDPNDYPLYVAHFIKQPGNMFDDEERAIIEVFFRHTIALVSNIESAEGTGKRRREKPKPETKQPETKQPEPQQPEPKQPETKPAPLLNADELADLKSEVRQGLREIDRRMSQDRLSRIDLEERIERLEEMMKRLNLDN